MSKTQLLRALKSGSAFDGTAFNRQLLDAVTKKTANDNLSVSDLSEVLREMKARDVAFTAPEARRPSPLSQQAFYDALASGIETAESVVARLEKIRDGAKQEKGYLSKAFSVFSHPRPLEKVVSDVAAFDRYCQKNGISYDEVRRELVAGPKPKTAFDHVKDFRLLAAAATGAVTGAMGLDALSAAPALQVLPDTFFKGIGYLALPFVTLCIAKTFSEKSLWKEAGTLGRFALTTTAGFAIATGVHAATSGMLPDLRDGLGAATATAGQAASLPAFVTQYQNLLKSMPSPMTYLMEGLGAGIAAGLALRKTREHAQKKPPRTALGRAFAAAAGAGEKLLDKALHLVDRGFAGFMSTVGVGATFLLMTRTGAGGVGEMMRYGGYYGAILTGLATTYTALGLGFALQHRYRWKEFKSLFKVASAAISSSSSAATMPTTRTVMGELGIRPEIANSTSTLGANFHMIGTTQYLGMVALSGMTMFGMPMTPQNLALAFAYTVLTAVGAPGMPMANFGLIEPVMRKTGFKDHQIADVYTMTLPGDRPLDMLQTGTNVLGDIYVAAGIEARERKREARKPQAPKA